MARNRREQSDPRVQDDWIKEGRGTGHFAGYQPWLRIQDVASSGIKQRLTSHLSGDRKVHVLSGLETDAFFILEWGVPPVVEIREQYPLLPLSSTQAIADELQVAHHHDGKTKLPIVPTTDFLVTMLVDGKEREIGVAVKPEAKLGSPREQQKLQIARTWHERQGHGWCIMTERDIPKYLARNLEFLRGRRDLGGFGGVPADDIARVEETLLPAIWKGQEGLGSVASACDTKLGLEMGTSLTVAYHFIYTRRWKVDLQLLMSPLEPGRPLPLVEPQPKETHGIIEKLSLAVAS